MHTEKSLPQADEMRQIIKNIFDLSTKLAYRIPISDLEDAADFAARLYGFKSWKEYKLYLNKDNAKVNFLIPNHIPVLPKFNKMLTKEIVEYDFKKHENIIKQNLLLNKNKNNILPEWLVGKYYVQKLKTDVPRGLKPLNTLITGSPASNIGTIFGNQINWLLNNNQPIIVFGGEENSKVFLQSKNQLLTNAKMSIIGKNYKKLNPIGELLESNELEAFFNFDLEHDNKFFLLWLQLVRKLTTQHNKNLNIHDLLNMTHLTTLLEMYKLWEISDPFLYTLLNEYLFAYCAIEDQEDGTYLINAIGMEYHHKMSCVLIEQLKQIANLYDQGYFSENENSFYITKAMFNKDNVFFIKEKNPYYLKIITQLYDIAYKQHHKHIQTLDLKLYSYYCIWWEAQTWLNEYNINIINQMEEEEIINFYYINSDFTSINCLLSKTEQILFLSQNITGYSQDWKNKMLCQSSKIDINIWYDNSKCLNQLEENEAVLWYIIDNTINPKGINEYHIEKIVLYDETVY